MSTPWTARRDDFGGASRDVLLRAQQALLEGEFNDERLQRVRPVIRSSWERARDMRVSTDTLPVLSVPDAEGSPFQLDHPLAGFRCLIRKLLLPGGEEDAGIVIGVGDAMGRLLWVEGDHSVRDQVDDLGFVAGADWSEHSVGTSAIGTALIVGDALQVRGAEHYNHHVHALSCTAAPVFDPETRDLLGVIDVSGGATAATAQARLLLAATARVVESEMLVSRLRERALPAQPTQVARTLTPRTAQLQVLGRDLARLKVTSDHEEIVVDLSPRHAEILLMLAVHRQGLGAGELAYLVYGPGSGPETLRPEMVRLRKVLERVAPALVPESRPYRLPVPLQTDAQEVMAYLERGFHRMALGSYAGPVLPDSVSPGVEALRDDVRSTMREVLLSEARLDVLLAYADIPEGRDDTEVLRLCLQMLPANSRRRAALVNRIEKLEEA